MKKANNYDKFASARQKEIRSGQKKPHRYTEKPMMKKLLPALKNKTALLLGCGTGEELKYLHQKGAKRIIGVDISKKSIDLANKTYSEYEFIVGDMHKLKFKNNSFDFVYSSLVVHYSKNPQKVYKEIYRILKPGGQFLFSLVHPIKWASEVVKIKGRKIRVLGFSEDNRRQKKYGHYHTFKEHTHYFPGNEVLKFWVGTPSFHFKLLKKSGFNIEDFIESQVTHECKRIDYKYYQRFREFPQFMAFLVKK